MNKLFYPKLAASNLKKNSKTYVPYILTCICTVMMYYIMYALSTNQGLNHMSGGGDVQRILSLGTYVIAVFSVIFLFYTNSFLIKRRKKEFGLFNVLGMEKRHLSKIILCETIYVAAISLILGILGGILLSKLMFLVLLKLLNYKVTLGFEVSKAAIIASLILFVIIFIMTLLNSIRQIHLAKPIELIKGSQTGEKEPKTKLLMTLIGLLTLGGGYYIAIITKEPLEALKLFFGAVILVIIGTYCLFAAGSIAILKLLRKQKNYYYKTRHFISVSGMMYRMKQNAVGLANICILSTMVLVVLSSTVSLYIGMEDVIRTRFPRNISITSSDFSDIYREDVKNVVEEVLKKHKLTAIDKIEYRYIDFAASQNGDTFSADRDTVGVENASNKVKSLFFIPLEDYNRMMNSSMSLEEDEILIYSNRAAYEEDTFSIFNKTFRVKSQLDSFIGDSINYTQIISSYYVIVKDISIVEEMVAAQAEAFGESDKSDPASYLGFDLKADNKESIAVYEEISQGLKNDNVFSYIESSAQARESFYALYGGLFFLGIFLGALFIMATILIIYYKQISEGYEDKQRFEIMQKVGMSRNEVKKTIHSQVLTVFFLPLVMAMIHIAFAFPVITKLLAILNLTNVTLFAYCTMGTIFVFGIFYAFVYGITAKEYYKIVK